MPLPNELPDLSRFMRIKVNKITYDKYSEPKWPWYAAFLGMEFPVIPASGGYEIILQSSGEPHSSKRFIIPSEDCVVTKP